MTGPLSFEQNVFINCPFDDAYMPLLRPMVFCVYRVGLRPRIALERHDSAEARIEKIIELIQNSKYGIHDLSRIKADKAGEMFRLNMPLELGIDIGADVPLSFHPAATRVLGLVTPRSVG